MLQLHWPGSPVSRKRKESNSSTRSILKHLRKYKDLGKEYQRERERKESYIWNSCEMLPKQSVPRGHFSEQVGCLMAVAKEYRLLEPIGDEYPMERVEGWWRSMVFRWVMAREAFLRCVPRKLSIATKCHSNSRRRRWGQCPSPFPCEKQKSNHIFKANTRTCNFTTMEFHFISVLGSIVIT